MRNIVRPSVLIPAMILCLALAGCGGSKVLKEPVQFTPSAALAAAADGRLEASVDWVIFRDGPGTWAKNADWDEYLLSVRNRSDSTLTITAVRVIDSLETPVAADDDRKRLIKASRQTTKRYKGQGVEVRAGMSGRALAVAGTAATVAAVGAGSAIVYGGAGLAAGVAGGLLIGPALAVGGIVKGANNSKVAKEIQARHTDLPLTIDVGKARGMDLFFALGPSPRRVEIDYSDVDGEHVLVVDTEAALAGLHLPETGGATAGE
ncbi:MAG: hypothetical protein OEW35_02450 [Gammaproteobacteria bacterium]|nr:hypothetical protein [Gammaproteobacteria bacterium]MDH4255472.1 hypothetical protein [Gammaproteobacteria bacterium]MDH5309513.1 hypothetical protein [Gammaproteobacteria bacterium]